MTGVDVVVVDGRVWVGTKDNGFYRMSPEAARSLAHEILSAADIVEGNRPANIHIVEGRT